MITDEMLAQACHKVVIAIANSVPDIPEELHTFSASFERKMKRLIKKVDHPVRYHFVRVAASFLLIIFLGFGAAMALSQTARAAVVGWVKERINDWVEYHYIGKETSYENNAQYYLSALPDEYIEVHSTIMDGYCAIIYDNNGTNMIFSYTTMGTDELFVDSDDCVIEEIRINDLPATLYFSSNTTNSYTLVWCDSKSQTAFYISAIMEKESLMALAESVRKK